MVNRQVIRALLTVMLSVVLLVSLLPVKVYGDTDTKDPPIYDWGNLDIYCYPNTCAVYPGTEYSVYMYVYNRGSTGATYNFYLDRCLGGTLEWGSYISPTPCYYYDDSLGWSNVYIPPGGSWSAQASVIASPGAPYGAWISTYFWAYPESSYDYWKTTTSSVRISKCPSSRGSSYWSYYYGCPIQMSTGENFLPHITELDTGGPLPLTFSRYYASGLSDDGFVDSSLGGNWMHNFDCSVNSLGVRHTVVDNTGQAIDFTEVVTEDNTTSYNFNYQQEPIRYELKNDDGDDLDFWFLNPAEELIYRFDINGNLEQIIDRNGNTLTITRDLNDRIDLIDDKYGRFLDFEYTAGGSLETVSDGSRTFTYGYDANGDLVSVEDPMGQITEYRYDPSTMHGPLMAELEYPLDNVHYTNTYDAQGRVITQVDADNNTVTLAYGSPAPGQTTATDGSGSQVYTHDGTLGKDLRDQANNTLIIDYDDRERPIMVGDRMGGQSSIAWDPVSGQIGSLTNAKGKDLLFSYIPQDQVFTNPDTGGDVTFTFYNLERIDYPDGTFRYFTYDDRGNVKTSQDQAGCVTEYNYYPSGNLENTINDKGGVTSFTYYPNGNMETSSNSDIGDTTYYYDSVNRLKTIEHPDGSNIEIRYNSNDQVTYIKDERGKTYVYGYDANGNLNNTVDPALENTQYVYDLMGRVNQATDRLNSQTDYTYDNMGRLQTRVTQDGILTEYDYDPRGWLNEITIDGMTWETTYNDEGIPTADISPEGRIITYQSNELGYLTKVINNLGHETIYRLGTMNRVNQIEGPLNRITDYSYDDRGLLDGITMPDIGSSVYQYNSLGLLELITDQENNNWEFGYTKTGLLHSGTDPLGNNSRYAYDERGRLDLAILPDGSQVTYEYDDASNVTGIHYGGGLDIDYSYDDLSRLDTTNNLDLDYDSEGRVTNSEYRGNNFGATYTNDGRLQTATYNNNHMIVTYTYDPANGRLTNVTDDLTGATVGFTYDNDGLLTGMTRSNGVNGTYTYDGAGRLDRIQDGEIIDLSYTLDAVGQVEQVDMNVPLAPWDCLNTKNDTFNYDAASQVISTGYSYDPLGRRITSSDNTYTWNGASQLTSPDEFTDLSYNGLGEIASRGVIGATTHYYHNHTIGLSPIVAEERVIPGPFTSQFTRYYVWTPGGKLLYMIDLEDSNEVYFYHFDITGSTLALSDSSGNVTDSYAYTPYGELLQHEGSMSQPFTYVGAGGVRQEGENGDLYQMRARYYDATTASFLSRDPVWPDISEPKALNPYSYAGQDPVTNVDLTGLRSYSINNRYSYYNYYSRYYGEYGPWSHGGYYQSYYKWYWRYDSRYSKLYSRQSTGRATAFSDKWLYDQNTGQWTRGRNIGSSSTSGNWEPIVGDWDGAGYDSVGSNNQQYIFWHCNPNTGQWPQGRNSSSHDVWYYNPNTGQWTQGSNSSCIDIRNNSPWVEIGSRSDVIVSPDISNAGSEIPHMLNPGLFQFGVRVSY